MPGVLPRRVRDVDRRAPSGQPLQRVPGWREQLLDRGHEVEHGVVADALPLPGQRHRQVSQPGRDVGLPQRVVDVARVVRRGERVAGVQVGRHDQGGVGGGAPAAADVDRAQCRGERLHLGELRLGAAAAVGEPEVEFEGVMPVGILPGQVVVVGVAPADPARRPGQQAVVQNLAVVAGGMLVAGEVRADAELLEHDRAAERAGEFALPGRRVVLTHLVVAHGIHVRAEEVAQRRGIGQREPGEPLAEHGAPGPVAQRKRLLAARGAHRVPDDLPPRGNGLPWRAPPAVDRHLVGDEPAAYRRVGAEAAHHLAGEPGLPRDHPDIAVKITAAAPGWIPVLAGHVPDDERRHRRHARLGVPVEEVGETVRHRLVDAVGGGHEVRPVKERAGHAQAVLAQHRQFLADRAGIVVAPHQRPAGPGPEVGTQPVDRLPGHNDPRGIAVHAESSLPRVRCDGAGPAASTSARYRHDKTAIPVKF